MKRTITAAVSAVAVLLSVAACSQATQSPEHTGVAPSAASTSQPGLEDLAALGAQDLIAALEETPLSQRRTDLRASIEPGRVLLTTADDEVAVPIEGQHYLSIAPYVTNTHECYFHSLTTCTGELGGQDVTIRVVDETTGEVYIDQSGPLEDNGFAGLWLPKDVTATVTVSSTLGEGTALVSTGDEDLTCLTSLQLT